MGAQERIQYISDNKGKRTAVIVPIALWQALSAEKETAYLLKSPAMKKRLLAAKKRTGGITLEDARAKLSL